MSCRPGVSAVEEGIIMLFFTRVMAAAEEHLQKAYGFYRRGSYESALEECESAISIDASIADAHNLRGALLEELDRTAEALASYETAVGIEPGFAEAEENLSGLRAEFKARSELVTVAVFNFLPEAFVPQLKLQSEGIWSFIADGEAVNVMPHASIAMDGVKLKVKPEDAGLAIRILNGEDSPPGGG